MSDNDLGPYEALRNVTLDEEPKFSSVPSYVDVRKAERMYLASRVRHFIEESRDEMMVILADEDMSNPRVRQLLATATYHEMARFTRLIGVLFEIDDPGTYRDMQNFADQFEANMEFILGY